MPKKSKLSDRIALLRNLGPGWLNDHGLVVHHDSLDRAEEFLALLGDNGSDSAGVFPSENGSNLVEWFIWTGMLSVYVEFCPNGEVLMYVGDFDKQDTNNSLRPYGDTDVAVIYSDFVDMLDRFGIPLDVLNDDEMSRLE